MLDGGKVGPGVEKGRGWLRRRSWGEIPTRLAATARRASSWQIALPVQNSGPDELPFSCSQAARNRKGPALGKERHRGAACCGD